MSNIFYDNIEKSTISNNNYREVQYTHPGGMQFVLMSVKPGEEIGMEVHKKHDQFIRIEEGKGELQIKNNNKITKDPRAFALQGNSVELAKELSRQLGTSAEFGNMNVIQQNSLDKAFGLSRDELAKTLETQDALKALGESSVEDAQKRFKILEKEVGTQEALQILGNNSLTQQFATASRQEKINALTDKFLALSEKLFISACKHCEYFGLFDVIGHMSESD